MATIKVLHEMYLSEVCTVGSRAGILHEIGPDCDRLHGLKVESVRCSVCDQVWDIRVASSEHERCATLYRDGSRRYAEPVTWLTNGDRVEYTTPYDD